ncbi:choice-of-anchor P family protein [Actinokineospora sp. HUAS TT18]|uniref:choice-of-anchor P family protein n=1 Tax=Actinokineospora sp. HUAS TT18 TaxID=3447451 RepID=UPI003F5271A6
MHKHSVRRGSVVGLMAAAALLVGALPASAAPGDGSAYVASANLTLLGSPAVNVGPLAPSNTNGPTDASLASINIPGVASAGVVTSQAIRDDATGAVHSEANLANVNLALANLGSIGAINVDCDATQAGNVGTTSLANVQIAGITVPVNPAPNTTFSVPPGPIPPPLVSITFNEQINNPDGSLTVNGVHIRLNALLGTGDVILASATCGPAAPPIPMASGAGLWIGLGLLGVAAIPVGITVLRRRRVTAAG